MLTIRNIIFVIFDLVMTTAQFRLPLPILHNINNCGAIIVMLI
jgi:hypothetical protein